MKLSEIKPNPQNPRVIKDESFKKLVQSLKDFPVMTELRPVVLDEDNVIIGGNMRYRAAKQAGWKEVEVKHFTKADAERNNQLAKELNPDFKPKTYEQYRQEFIIKDNVSGGEWDWALLANEWDMEQLDGWGLELPVSEALDDTPNELNEPEDFIISIRSNDKSEIENILVEIKRVAEDYNVRVSTNSD
jgi:hypothetical protein